MLKRLMVFVVLFSVALLASSDAFARVGGPNIRARAQQTPTFNFNQPAQTQLPQAQQQQPTATPSYQPAPMAAPTQQPVQQQVRPAVPGQVTEYVLGVGDRLKITVYGEEDLSGEYDVSSTGIVSMPLIGDVAAAGQPLRIFEQAVRYKLAQGYLKDPRVSAQVINYRPFFILGQVTKPGSYPYVNGMTVMNAVALAGGYTYRADNDDIRIKHAKDGGKQEVRVGEGEPVQPGDIIRVPERFF